MAAMAITPVSLSAGTSEPVSTFTMSLTRGWDKIPAERGGRPLAPGDVVILAVRKPFPPVAGPSGWVAATSNVFYRTIAAGEPDPVFYAAGAEEWEIEGYAVAGTDLQPFSDAGSAVPWTTTTTDENWKP